LTFEWPTLRKKVHPEISEWTTHKDTDLRAKAAGAIARGKAEGWKTIEEFRAAISEALVPPPPPGHILKLRQASGRGDYAAPWVALITGTSPLYGYSRTFLDAYSRAKGGPWNYAIAVDGVYQVCDRNSRGAKNLSWLRVQQGVGSDISQAEAVAIVGQPAEVVTKGRSLNDPLPLTSDSSKVVEECWECGALYSSAGYVEDGNMGCRSCA
jgi:hypothetical protein